MGVLHYARSFIVGAGLSYTFAARQPAEKKVKVIDKRDHIGGNIYRENGR